jgi:hypothetical protein
MSGRGILAAVFILSLGFLTACEKSSTSSSGMFGRDGPGGDGVSRGTTHGFLGGVNPGAMQRGTDSFLDEGALRDSGRSQAIVVPADGETVQLSLVNASIEAAAKAVLSDTLGLNYDPDHGADSEIRPA